MTSAWTRLLTRAYLVPDGNWFYETPSWGRVLEGGDVKREGGDVPLPFETAVNFQAKHRMWFSEKVKTEKILTDPSHKTI